MSYPSEFKRSIEYMDRTRSNLKNYDYVSQEIADAIEKNDKDALLRLMNNNK